MSAQEPPNHPASIGHPSSRREFLLQSAALTLAAGALGSGLVPGLGTSLARADGKAQAMPGGGPGGSGKLSVLILGGTGFLGPACTQALLAKGHKVTLFNRGHREEMRKKRGRPSQIPAGVDVIYGNRDPERTADEWKEGQPDAERDPNSPKGLSQLEGKAFDAVIDTSGYFPRHVKASAELLAKTAKHYLFISSISVYADNSTPDQDESGLIARMPPDREDTEDFGPMQMHYGPLKALCEEAAEKAMPGRVTNIRPGFIVGPLDTSARYLFWPRRISQGGEMILPGTPEDPIQMIDVRDLAEWMVLCLENKTTGVFNATSPADMLTMRKFVEGCREGVKAAKAADGSLPHASLDTSFTWIDQAWLAEHEVSEQDCHMMFPLWLPSSGETAGFHRNNVKKALAQGLKFRSPSETARTTMEWYLTLPKELQERLSKPPRELDADREKGLLVEWKAKK